MEKATVFSKRRATIRVVMTAVFALTLVAHLTASSSYEVVHSFSAETGFPQSPVLQASDGKLYGTVASGGYSGLGSIFVLAPDGTGGFTYSTIHYFTGGDGIGPLAGLVQAADGNFYGTTSGGGAGGGGTVFKLDSAGNLTTLHSFAYSDGGNPYGSLVQAADGNFYGTTYQGGSSGAGTVFKMDASGNLTTLHSFTYGDGAYLYGGLIQAADGNFYGTTYQGGSSGAGTVFKMDASGNLTTLHSFAYSDGSSPRAGLVQAADGNLYGTTLYGGTSGAGTVFKMDVAGNLITLHSFASDYPYVGVIQATDGNFYGTTSQGGANRYGTVFKMDGSGNLTTLHSFALSDGVDPFAALIQATDGNFYGTTFGGGDHSAGTVFKMDGSGNLTTLHSFVNSDGEYPYSGLIQAADGNFYGTTDLLGTTPVGGSIFKMDTAGNFTTLHLFAFSDGAEPHAALIQATDGNFYGTTSLGGAGREGVVFKMDAAGNVTPLNSFTGGSDGASPYARLLRATDGHFYGTNYLGGAGGGGTVFKMDVAGNRTTVHSFTGGSDGASPYAGLIQATDGNFYGTTFGGGDHSAGTVFKMDASGNLTTLHSFVNSDGANPYAGVMQAADGNFYGTTVYGGASGEGTVFKMDAYGNLTTLHSFSYSDGAYPYAGLIQATDGNFYGTTNLGGAGDPGTGTVFEMDVAGNVTTLHSFTDSFAYSDGSQPYAALIQASDRKLYGTTLGGGPGRGGVIFRLSLPNSAPQISSIGLSAASIPENGSVTLSGSFTDADAGDAHSVSITWGDGSVVTTSNLPAGVFTFSSTHQYLDDNPTGTPSDVYGISVSVTDSFGATGSSGTVITVANVAPVVTGTASPAAPIALGGSASVSATFTDVGSLDSHICVFVWDDGTPNTTVTPAGTGNGSCSASHTYGAAGVYDASVNITDDDTGSVTAEFGYIVIYDPNGGFVTGGGWFNSPAGAYPANPTLSGKANFGFVAKYQSGVPVGETEFHFGGLNLHGSSYDWLVISGAKGQYQGSGTVNDTGNYGFLVTVIDGQAPGGGGIDKLRVKIWDKNNGNAVVYDNQMGAPNGANPTTAIGGGSIVLHN